jgi:DNA-binding NarL/FixJ family response regulator
MELYRALLVDDHPLFREGFMAAVQQKLPNISFTVAGSVGEARSTAQVLRPDLILADWRLPDGN